MYLLQQLQQQQPGLDEGEQLTAWMECLGT